LFSKDPESIERIVVLCFPGLGDTILFSPCITPIRSHFRNAEITIVTMFKSSAQVLEKNPEVDRVFYQDFLNAPISASLRYFANLRKQKYDLSILPFPSYRREYNIASYLVGAKYRAAHRFPTGYISQLTFLNNITVPVERSVHNAQNNLNLLSALGMNITDHKNYRLEVTVDANDLKDADSTLESLNISHDDMIIGIHPGSFGRAKEKRWSEENFAGLCELLDKKFGAKILMFIGPEEVDLADKITTLCNVKLYPVVNKPIRTVYALLKLCKLLICDDSGLMHLGAAANTKIVAIFGPTDNRILFPWGPEHRIVRSGIECSPCYYYDQVRSKNSPLILCTNSDKFACIKSIALNNVMDSVNDLLS